MAMIFQEPMTALNPAYTIGDQLIEVHRRHKGSTRAAGARARRRAAGEGRHHGRRPSALGQYPHQLSGGLRQRVMIAMALMCGPTLLIADEPTTALDVTIQAQILRLLAGSQRDLGIAMLLITHDLGVVARVADRVAVMYAGEIVEGPVDDIFARPLPSLYARAHGLDAGARQGTARRAARRDPGHGAGAHRRRARLRVPRPLRARKAHLRRAGAAAMPAAHDWRCHWRRTRPPRWAP